MSGGIFNEEAIIQIIQKFTYVSQKQGWYSILRRDACKTGSSTVLTQKSSSSLLFPLFLALLLAFYLCLVNRVNLSASNISIHVGHCTERFWVLGNQVI